MNEKYFQDYEVILNAFKALENDKQEEATECFDGNFKSVILKETVGGNEYIELFHKIKEGIPDAKFSIEDLTTDGETFKAKIKVTGTHSKVIPSLKKGWKAMKPTGKKINKIVSSVEVVLRSDRIIEIRNLETDKGVISGLLSELKLLPKNYSMN